MQTILTTTISTEGKDADDSDNKDLNGEKDADDSDNKDLNGGEGCRRFGQQRSQRRRRMQTILTTKISTEEKDADDSDNKDLNGGEGYRQL